MRVMVTGHRPPKIGGYTLPNPTEQWIRKGLQALLTKLKTAHPELHAVTGMALGVDTIFAEVCIELKIPFTAAVPFLDQEKQWPQKSRDHYFDILSEAHKSVVVADLPAYASPTVRGQLLIRNLWMVEHSQMTIAVWDGSKSGTANAVAESQKIPDRKIIHLNPLARTMGIIKPHPRNDYSEII